MTLDEMNKRNENLGLIGQGYWPSPTIFALFVVVMFDVLPQFLPPHLVQHLAFAIVDHFVRERDLLGVSAR